MPKKINQFFDTDRELAALGVFAVIFLETIALLKGADGVMFGAAMAAVGVIIGYVFKGYRLKK